MFRCFMYTLSNKNPLACYFVCSAQAVTWHTVAIIIRTENWPDCDNIVINPKLSGGRVPLQDKFCHKSEPHWEYVEWGEKDTAGTWPLLPPRNSNELWAIVSDAWDEAASLQYYIRSLSPWHDEWNQWSKQKGSGLLTKVVNFWKQPF